MATPVVAPPVDLLLRTSRSPPNDDPTPLASSTYNTATPGGSHPAHVARRDTFVLGTRNSKLAMVQTVAVKAQLEKNFPNLDVKIVSMCTGGDNNLATPLYLLGGKALWTKELEVALLHGQVDAIVHCLKDIPTEFPPGCELGAILEREDPSDALVMKAGLPYKSLDELPAGSVIGTSSVRRVAQLRRRFPQLKFSDVRGNVITRLKKLDDPELPYSALVLASAGLIRLGLAERITMPLRNVLHYAVGQGALAIEMRSSDPRSAEIVASLEDWKTSWACRAERAMLMRLEGGCSVPVGTASYLVEEADLSLCPIVGSHGVVSPPTIPIDPHASPNGISNGRPLYHPYRQTSPHDPHTATLTLTGTITSLSGTSAVSATETRVVHSIEEAESLGRAIAEELISSGGRTILEELGRHVKEVNGEDGKEIPFHAPSQPINIPPSRGGVTYSTEPRQPLTVFKDSEVCLRPQGW